jgi:hypothetical protein
MMFDACECAGPSRSDAHGRDHCAALEIRRSSFESHYGRRLVWDTRLGRKRCLIGDYRIGSIDHVGAEGDYEDYVDWFIDCGERLRATIDRVRAFARGPS